MLRHPSRERPVLLVIDDDPDIGEMLGLILDGLGYDVVSAANGREALQHLQEGLCPCLILLDLMMPVMDGWLFRAAQLEDESLASIPIIVLSGNGTVDRDAPLLGAAAYLKKPFELDELLQAIELWKTEPSKEG